MNSDSPIPKSLTEGQIRLVQESWRELAPKEALVARQFYARLFDLDPELEPMFSEIDMEAQGRKFTDIISMIVKGLDHFDVLVPSIEALGGRHADYGVLDEHYEPVKRALLGVLADNLGDKFAGETGGAWNATYDALADLMKRGFTDRARA